MRNDWKRSALRHVRFMSILVVGVLAATPVLAQSPDPAVATVLDKYHSALPARDDLTIYCLDWVPTFDEAKQKAAGEGRPILLAVVTNSYGDLFSGHC